MVDQYESDFLFQVNTQAIPPADPLVANMPTGREVHQIKPYMPPTLDEDTLASLRAPPDRLLEGKTMGDDDSSSEEEGVKGESSLPGAFPGSSATSTRDNVYY